MTFCCFRLAQSTLGDEVENTAGVVIARNQFCTVEYFTSAFLWMMTSTPPRVTDSCHAPERNSLQCSYVAVFVGHQNGALKLPGFFRLMRK